MTATTPPFPTDIPEQELNEERRRRRLLFILLALLLALCAVLYLFVRYLIAPQPLPDLLPPPIADTISYPPSYTFSISGVDKPVSVAVSPDSERIYVAEGGGERLLKIFTRDGVLVTTFQPPGTDAANRDLRYLAVDPTGRVFVNDRTANAIHIFDRDGAYIDSIVSPTLTLSRFLQETIPGGMPAGTTFHYEGINRIVYYNLPDGTTSGAHLPPLDGAWLPLGLRFDPEGNLLYSDLTPGNHSVRFIPASALTGSLESFNPEILSFGVQGTAAGQFDFPQVAVRDSAGNYYVSDGNNYRISRWSTDMQYLSFFGFSSSESGLNLPRGMWIDGKDRLHVADAVGSYIRVYDVSGPEPEFLFNFGGFGLNEGFFSYPIDLTIDSTGRLYIADRENNRIRIWSY